MVHVIYFFKEHIITESGGVLANGHDDVTNHEYRGKLMCSFSGKEATPIISWLMKNVEHSRNTYTIFGNPKVGISVFSLMKLLDNIDECLEFNPVDESWVNFISIMNFFSTEIKTSSSCNVSPKEYLSILRKYRDVFEPLVYLDEEHTDYNNSGNWFYQIVSEHII